MCFTLLQKYQVLEWYSVFVSVCRLLQLLKPRIKEVQVRASSHDCSS